MIMDDMYGPVYKISASSAERASQHYLALKERYDNLKDIYFQMAGCPGYSMESVEAGMNKMDKLFDKFGKFESRVLGNTMSYTWDEEHEMRTILGDLGRATHKFNDEHGEDMALLQSFLISPVWANQ
jgi:hypothetical protein